MTDAPNIHEREELEAFLNNLTKNVGEEEGRRIAVSIAHRAAMRVLPFARDRSLTSEFARDRDLTPLPALRASFISGVAGTWPIPLIKEASASAAADGYASVDAYASASAAYAYAASVDASAGAFAYAAFAAAYAAYASAAYAHESAASAIWSQLLKDAAIVSASRSARGLSNEPLWHNENPLADEWDDLRDRIADLDDASDRAFWVRWYEAALAGRLYHDGNEALLTDIARIDPDDWDKGPTHIAALIREIEGRHAVTASPNAETILLDEVAKQYRAEPVTALDGSALDYAVIKLRNALKIIDVDPTANRMLGSLAPERDMLREALSANQPHPRALYDTCLRVLRRLNAKVENGDLPQAGKDADLDDFHAQIDETQLDLLADPEVKAMATNRAFLRMERASPEDAASLPEAAEGLEPATNAALGEEIAKDAAVAVDPAESEDNRREALYRFGSRLVRMYAIARKAGKEGVLLAGGMAALAASIGLTVKNAAAVETAFNFFLRLFGI